jgi:hypothetical protein
MAPPKPSATVVVLVALAIAALVGFLAILPPLLVPDGKINFSDHARLLGESSIRSTILQLVGGLVVVFGIVYTAAQFGVSRETHFTDRYTKAIDQLGHQQAVVRMGAIFALQRLALNSKIDRPTVIEVLNGYLRSASPLPPGTGVPAVSTEIPSMDSDIQAALTVLVELYAVEA